MTPPCFNKSISTSQHKTAVQTPTTERSRGVGTRRPPRSGHVAWGPDWRKTSETTPCPLSTSRSSLRPHLPCSPLRGQPLRPPRPHPAVPVPPSGSLRARCPPPGASGTAGTSRPSASRPPPLVPPALALLAPTPLASLQTSSQPPCCEPPPQVLCVTLPIGHRCIVFFHHVDRWQYDTASIVLGALVCYLTIKPVCFPCFMN